MPNMTKMIAIRLNAQTLKSLKKLADDDGRSVSGYARQILEGHISKKKKS